MYYCIAPIYSTITLQYLPFLLHSFNLPLLQCAILPLYTTMFKNTILLHHSIRLMYCHSILQLYVALLSSLLQCLIELLFTTLLHYCITLIYCTTLSPYSIRLRYYSTHENMRKIRARTIGRREKKKSSLYRCQPLNGCIYNAFVLSLNMVNIIKSLD